MTRREDWPERLLEAVARHDVLPYSLGESDSYMLTMDAVLAMTGAEPWPEVRGSYSTALGAAKLLRQRGFSNEAEAFASVFPEVPPALAIRGDIGVVPVPHGAGFAGVVCIGTGFVGKHADRSGTIRVPRSAVLRAFRV